MNNESNKDPSETTPTATSSIRMGGETPPTSPTPTPITTVVNNDPSSSLPLRMTSIVVKGYGRGSSDLGIPTANLDRTVGQYGSSSSHHSSFEDLPTGIYWGFCRIGTNQSSSSSSSSSKSSIVYKTACSIGYNPYYGNQQKPVEPHMIAPPDSEFRHRSSCGDTMLVDFFNQPFRLSLVGYLRPELPFEGLEKLVAAIKKDIVDSERLCDSQDPQTLNEKQWVMSDEPIDVSVA